MKAQEPQYNKRLEVALKNIIERSHNGTLGTSKVIDMRNIAIKALEESPLLYVFEDLIDEIDCLKSELDCAIETAYNRGAHEWVKLNYPKHYEKLSLNAKPINAPKPFWKPIEQCPKVEFKEYFLYRVGYGPWVGFYKDSKLIAVDTAENLDIRGITHYAEIPPLEAGE